MAATVVIPQKTNSQMTLDLVRQIHEYEPDAEIVVIHDTQDDLMGELPNCRVIRNRGTGVTAAWNHGIEESANDHVILLNNDVVCSGAFVELVAPWGDLIVGSKFRRERLIGAAADLLPGGAESEWLEGWCLSFRKSLWGRLGGFDESMRLYFSDLDFQVRAARMGASRAGFSRLPLRHIGRQTTRLMSDSRVLWNLDRNVFIGKLCGGAT